MTSPTSQAAGGKRKAIELPVRLRKHTRTRKGPESETQRTALESFGTVTAQVMPIIHHIAKHVHIPDADDPSMPDYELTQLVMKLDYHLSLCEEAADHLLAGDDWRLGKEDMESRCDEIWTAVNDRRVQDLISTEGGFSEEGMKSRLVLHGVLSSTIKAQLPVKSKAPVKTPQWSLENLHSILEHNYRPDGDIPWQVAAYLDSTISEAGLLDKNTHWFDLVNQHYDQNYSPDDLRTIGISGRDEEAAGKLARALMREEGVSIRAEREAKAERMGTKHTTSDTGKSAELDEETSVGHSADEDGDEPEGGGDEDDDGEKDEEVDDNGGSEHGSEDSALGDME